MVVKLKSIKPLVYAGKRIALGQEFDATGESDARVLTAIKSAVRVTETAPAPKSVYNTRMMTAQVPQAITPVSRVIAKSAEPVAALPEVDWSSYTTDSAPIPVHPESDLDSMDRDALFDLAVSMGLKPHGLAGAAKLRGVITEHRGAQ